MLGWFLQGETAAGGSIEGGTQDGPILRWGRMLEQARPFWMTGECREKVLSRNELESLTGECLPFYWILSRHDFQVCLPLSPFCWILFRHDFQVSLLLDSVPSWFPISLCLLSTAFSSVMMSLCLPSPGSCFVTLSSSLIWMLVSLSSLLNSLYKDPFLLWFGGVSYFVFPSIFLAGTWFEVKI